MSVVLRCPNCGTTRATPGVCEGCNEARARYFCTDHTPGLWLPTATCPQCGARFGEPAREAPAYMPTPTIRPPAPSAVPLPRSSEPKLAPHTSARRVDSPPAARRVRTEELSRDEPSAAREGWAVPHWQQVLGAILRARSASVAARTRDGSPLRVARGCMARLAIVVLLVALGLGLALYFFAHSLLQSSPSY